MPTIHDKERQMDNWEAIIKSASTADTEIEKEKNEEIILSSERLPDTKDTREGIIMGELPERQQLEIKTYLDNAENALALVDDVVMKNYLSKLSDLEVVKSQDPIDSNDIVLFRINRMVYEKDEYATEKFISALSAMTYANCSVFLIVDGHIDHADFYLGIRNNDPRRTTSSISSTFENSLKGQFPGIELEDCSVLEECQTSSDKDRLLRKMKGAVSVSSFVGIPSYKSEKSSYNNLNYVQGIEKLVLAMRGKEYTAVVLANNLSNMEINGLRKGYEGIYSELSTLAQQQLSYSTNESLANAITRSKSTSHSTSNSQSKSESTSESTSNSHSEGKNWGTSTGTSESKPNFWAKGSKFAGDLAIVGSILTGTGIGSPVGIALLGTSAVLGVGGVIGEKTKGTSASTNEGHSSSDSTSESKSISESTSTSQSWSDSESISDSTGKTSSIGSSKNFTLTVRNKNVEELLKRIDKQLERISACEGQGLWSAGAYFLSYDKDKSTAETAAAIFKSIMQGETSGVETSAVNSWIGAEDNTEKLTIIKDEICSLTHPTFNYRKEGISQDIQVTSSSLLSSKEVAMMLGLPRKSVPGLAVTEHISLGKEVIRQSGKKTKNSLELGWIFDQGSDHKENSVSLDSKSLTQHTFVTGSTGCGKSETVYRIISEAKKAGATFLIIEPAKGEYKTVFGNANVFGTNPMLTQLLRINPFRFPKGIHVLEHIDRLIEIFNVCWPMYAAMPAVLKKAMLQAYEKSGWNLIKSRNAFSSDLFPSFVDLLAELESVIKESAYSEEVKGNYTGSLVTRVESLTNGINGEIFSANEIPEKVLFDEDTIVDLSRVGSQETKSLIMGIMIMRLSEYRMAYATEANAALKHITVLEEAHNILKNNTVSTSGEGGNVAAKAVEMITNAIAEMRTYGEGFVIVDQSPTSVDIAAIKNTNTKIVMRLPDGDDRRLAGKAAAMKDSEVDEIAKLPTGVAVAYQNDWIEPVLCRIRMFDGERIRFSYDGDVDDIDFQAFPIVDALSFLLSGRLSKKVDFDIDKIADAMLKAKIASSIKIQLSKAINEYRENRTSKLWEDDNFPELASLVTSLTGLRSIVANSVSKVRDFEQLNDVLSDAIKEELKAPASLELAIRQCLMKDYGQSDSERAMIYNAWFQETRKNLVK